MLVSGSTMIRMGDGLADSTPMVADASYYASSGIELSGLWAAYAGLYKAQPWIYALVRKLGVGVARLPLKVYDKTDAGRAAVPDSAYAELLRSPNPRLGAKALWLWTESTYELYGEAIWIKLRDENRRVREIYPIHPTNMTIRRNEAGETVYVYTAGSRVGLLPPFSVDDVVHFRGYNPDNLTRGLSPCEPLRQTLLSEDAARRAQAAMWRNGARPSVVLSHPKNLSDPAQRRLKAGWDATHAGVDSWAKTAILEEGMTPHVMQLSPDDMQYLAGRQLNREECCGVYDVPPPAVHILDRATFSNITEQSRMLYRDSMAPRLGLHEDTLATQLAPDFYPIDGPDVYAEFLLDEVLRGAFEPRTTAMAQAIGTGQMTPNEARRAENRPDVTGGDQLLVNAALIPLKVVEATSPGSGGDVVEQPQKIKTLSARDARTVAGRLSRATSVEDVDEHVLTAGLASGGDDVRALVLAARSRGDDVPTLRAQIAASVTDPLLLDQPEEAP